MRVGLAYSGTVPLGEFIPLARSVEQTGLDSIWFMEELFFRDQVIQAAVFASQVGRLDVTVGPLTPYLRDPFQIARELLTLEEVAPGRVSAYLGVGDMKGTRDLGIPLHSPVQKINEALSTLRGFITSGQLPEQEDHRLFQTSRTISLYLAAMGPQMLALSRQAADGTVISGMMSPLYLQETLRFLKDPREGPAGRPHHTAVVLVVSVAESYAQAVQQVKPIITPWIGVSGFNQAHTLDWQRNNLYLPSQSIRQALAAGDRQSAYDLVDDRAVSLLTLTGDAHRYQAKLEEWAALGMDEIILVPAGDARSILLTLRLTLDVARRLDHSSGESTR